MLCYIGAKYHIVVSRKLNLFLRKSIKLLPPSAPFGPDMHQIVCRLGLRPRPHWGSLQRSPDPLAGLRGPTSKGRGGKGRVLLLMGGGEEREGKGRGRGEGMEEGDGRTNPKPAATGLLQHVRWQC